MGILGIGAGLLTDELNDQRAQRNAYTAFTRTKQLTDYNKNAQLDLWQRTGYGAEVDQMKEAGLNPALMYKGAGNGGSVALATGKVDQAPTIPSKIIEGMGMSSQMELQKAQTDNLKADTEKKVAETTEVQERTPTYKKGMEKTDAEIGEIATKLGVNVETAKKLIQDVEESKSRVPINVATVPKVEAETGKTTAETNKAKAETLRIEKLTPMEAELLENEVKSSITRNIYLGSKERQELNNMITDNIVKIKQIKVNQNQQEAQQFAEEIKANYPSVWNVIGRGADVMTSGAEAVINWLTGGEKHEYHKVKQ